MVLKLLRKWQQRTNCAELTQERLYSYLVNQTQEEENALINRHLPYCEDCERKLYRMVEEKLEQHCNNEELGRYLPLLVTDNLDKRQATKVQAHLKWCLPCLDRQKVLKELISRHRFVRAHRGDL